MEIPNYLTYDYITSHPEWTFVYPTNFWNNQNVGPAKICKGLTNTFGVPVRWRLCKSSGYFQDSQIIDVKEKIDEMIAAIPRDKPIILFPKIGSGHSQMKRLAPKCYAYLHSELDKIKTPVTYYAT